LKAVKENRNLHISAMAEWTMCMRHAVTSCHTSAVLSLIALRNEIQRVVGIGTDDDMTRSLVDAITFYSRCPSRKKELTGKIINIILLSGADRYSKYDGRTAYNHAKGRINAYMADRIRFLEKHVTLFELCDVKLQVIEYEELVRKD
jgi:hypothetical protein